MKTIMWDRCIGPVPPDPHINLPWSVADPKQHKRSQQQRVSYEEATWKSRGAAAWLVAVSGLIQGAVK